MDVPIYDTSGKKIDTFVVDEGVFGTKVNVALVKQAVVAYQANRRQGTAVTKGRGDVHGSGKKMYRQKGTGNARRGNRRTNQLRGGGNAFAKEARSFRQKLPKKMRRAAVRSAILAKLLGENLLIVDGLTFEAPRTSRMAEVLDNLKIDRSCLVTLAERDGNCYLSARNIRGCEVRIVEELNAYDVATKQKMLVTREAMVALTAARPEAGE